MREYYDPTSRGWHDLAMAIILQAIYDIRVGMLADRFAEGKRTSTKRNMTTALDFMKSEWALALAEDFDLDDFVSRTMTNIAREITFLEKEITLTGGGKQITGNLYELANQFNNVTPDKVVTYIKSHTKGNRLVLKKGGVSFSATFDVDLK